MGNQGRPHFQKESSLEEKYKTEEISQKDLSSSLRTHINETNMVAHFNNPSTEVTVAGGTLGLADHPAKPIRQSQATLLEAHHFRATAGYPKLHPMKHDTAAFALGEENRSHWNDE